MQFAKSMLAGIAVVALISAIASADVNDKKTTLTVNETIEVPGAVLEPGKYVVKLVDSQANRHIVQFFNEEENEVLSTVIAIPNMRLKPTGETEFEWHETPAGQPPALKAWFYPGDSFGQEFAYPEGRATELSRATNGEVPRLSDEDAAIAAQRQETIAQAPAPQPQTTERTAAQQAEQDREREAAAQRERDMQAQRDRETAAQRERDLQAQRDRERQAAQAAQNQEQAIDPNLTAQQTPQSQSTGNELPQTAGFGALLALIGLGALGASRAVRNLRSK